MTSPEIIGLFEGYGGLTMATQAVLGGQLIAYSEIDPAACRLLAHRNPGVPNLGDVTAIDWAIVEHDAGRPLIVTGGFPCQDVSLAGRRAGLRPDTRSGLWAHMAFAIGQLRPDLVVIENVRGLLSAEAHCDVEPCPWCVGDGGVPVLRALGAVLGSLAELGYDARWVGLRAADVGAPHGRFRIFITAWPATDTGSARRGQSHLDTADDTGTDGAGQADRTGRRGQPAPDATGDGRHEGWAEPARLVGGLDAPVGGGQPAPDPDSIGSVRDGSARRRRAGSAHDDLTAADTDGDGLQVVRQGTKPHARDDADGRGKGVRWGDYEPAIRRWEHILGRVAPAPTTIGKRGGRQLSPLFVEWLMGLPGGHVTAVPGLSRNEQLKILGNGVVPQQAEAALRCLLATQMQEAAA